MSRVTLNYHVYLSTLSFQCHVVIARDHTKHVICRIFGTCQISEIACQLQLHCDVGRAHPHLCLSHSRVISRGSSEVRLDLSLPVLSAIESYTQPCQFSIVENLGVLILFPIPFGSCKCYEDVARELLAGNAGDSPRRTQFVGAKFISIDSYLSKVQTTSGT